MTVRLSLLASLLLLSACAQPGLYDWNGYDRDLREYYKDPTEVRAFAAQLKESIDKIEDESRVPPGLYAEYGYALLQLEQPDQAIEYFERERARWPESAALMDRLIGRLSGTMIPANANQGSE